MCPHVCVGMCTWVRHLWRLEVSDAQVSVSCPMWVLGSEFWYCAKAAKGLKFWTISPVLIMSTFDRKTNPKCEWHPGFWVPDWIKRRKLVDCRHYHFLLPVVDAIESPSLNSHCHAFLTMMHFHFICKPKQTLPFLRSRILSQQWDNSLTDIFNFLCSHGLRLRVLQGYIAKSRQSIDNSPKSGLL